MAISRAELPAEFFDITSKTLLLQPEPQYVYAQLYLAFLGQIGGLDVPELLGRVGAQVGGQGAPYADPATSRLILATSPLPQAIFANPMDKQFEPHQALQSAAFHEHDLHAGGARDRRQSDDLDGRDRGRLRSGCAHRQTFRRSVRPNERPRRAVRPGRVRCIDGRAQLGDVRRHAHEA